MQAIHLLLNLVWFSMEYSRVHMPVWSKFTRGIRYMYNCVHMPGVNNHIFCDGMIYESSSLGLRLVGHGQYGQSGAWLCPDMGMAGGKSLFPSERDWKQNRNPTDGSIRRHNI